MLKRHQRKCKTYVEQAAKRPPMMVQRNIQDLTTFIRTRTEKQPEKVVTIRPPPKSTSPPIEYLARIYNPGNNIKVQHIRQVRDKVSLIVRLSSEVKAVAVMRDEVSVLKGCTVRKIDYRYPRVVVSGTSFEHKEKMAMDLYHQYQAHDEYDDFAADFIPLRSWRGREKDMYT